MEAVDEWTAGAVAVDAGHPVGRKLEHLELDPRPAVLRGGCLHDLEDQ